MPLYRYKNLDMYYQIKGDGETALLFIHGLGGYGKVWKYQTDLFSNHYTTVTIDLFGHGQSSKDIDPLTTPWLIAQSAVNLMTEMVKQPYLAIGHSYAMDILPEIIRLDQDYLKGVVFVDCTYHNNLKIARERAGFAELMLSYTDERLKEETKQWYHQYIGPYPKQEDMQLITASLELSNPRWMFQSVYDCLKREETRPHKLTPKPENLNVLIVEAGYGLGFDLDKSWVNHFKTAEYYFLDRGHHFLFVTEHDKFNSRLWRFLREDISI